MTGVTQDNRVGGFRVDGLDTDHLVLSRLTGEEKLGRPYLFHVQLTCEVADVDFSGLVGKAASVWLEGGDGEERYWSGIISSFRLVGSDREGNTTYMAEIRPWLWLLTKTADCRIFQQKTVPDIIKEVFGDFGFSDFEENLAGTYRTWEYCVQYRETAFNFVSRLMEQEGIYYYFVHEDMKSTLVLSDGFQAHVQIPGESIPFVTPTDTDESDEVITQWEVGMGVRSGSVVLEDYDFLNPTADLKKTCVANLNLADGRGEYEIYDYPGEYIDGGDGDAYSQIRLEELQADWSTVTGRGDAVALCPGVLFDLRAHPRDDQNAEHLLMEARYLLRMPDSGQTAGGTTGQYSVTFRATNSENPFRSARITPKPSIQGPQTAVIVGASGEEIWTDEHGRVKLLFHWDRVGKETKDENCSCWVRVSQAWAGAGWGSIHIPRMGQEVIVEFLEGDPDRPIVTGRVYNGDNPVPYALPANGTQSGILSDSSKGGGGSNELRFEDKKDGEQIFFHAEKDYKRTVKNNETVFIGSDRKVEIKNDEAITIDNDETVEIKNDETVTIGNNQSTEIASNETRKVGADQTVEVGANVKRDTGADETVSIGANEKRSIGADLSVDVGGSRALTMGADDEITVGANHSISAGMASSLEAGMSIDLKCGASSISIAPDKISIKSPQIMIEGDYLVKLDSGLVAMVKGEMLFKAEGGLMSVVKAGLKADLKSSLMAGVTGSAVTKLKGGVLKAN